MPNKTEHTRYLPHFQRIGATFFVTFRLYESLPLAVIQKLTAWFRAEQEAINKAPALEREALLFELRKVYFFKLDKFMDQYCFGPCYLKYPDVALIVAGQFHRFDGDYYHLLAYTIMPNHIHILLDFSAQLKDGRYDPDRYKNLDYVMNRIKGASARYANLHLRRTGEHFWHPEYFDRYIRDERHLNATIDYIKNNPVKAGICRHWMEHPFTWSPHRFYDVHVAR